MGVKKEKSPIQLMEELVVKFGQLYSTDMYIYKRKFCVSGIESSDNLLGDVICTLNDEWIKVLGELEVPDIFYIPNIKEFRAKFKENTIELSDFRESVSDQSVETMILEMIASVTKEHDNPDNVWTPVVQIPGLLKTIFDDKLIYHYTITDENRVEEEISLAKQLFPMMNEKTAFDAYIIVKKSNEFETLCTILVDFAFSHFKIQCVYHALPTPIPK